MTRPFRTRRIALVVTHPWKLVESSIRYEIYVEGMAKIGVEAITICREGSQGGYKPRAIAVGSDEELHERRFWSELDCEAAVVLIWHGDTPLLRAVRSAGVKVLALCDTDGCVSPIYHPASDFMYAFTNETPTPRAALRKVYYQLRAASKGFRGAHHNLALNATCPSVFTLPSTGAIAEFDKIMTRSGHASVVGTVRWLPYPVPHYFCEAHFDVQRPRQMIAVGRWDAWQKNAPLLGRAIRRVLASGQADIRFVIAGRGSERAFADLAGDHPGHVRVLGPQPRELIAEEMATSRAIIVSSRWEGSPIVANEMLAVGGTVVGTPIPSLRSIVEGDRFGRVCSRHTSRALARAIIDESATWDAGRRDPEQIAAHWRPLVSPEDVALRILTLLEAAPT